MSVEHPVPRFNPMGMGVMEEIRQLAPVFTGKPDGPTWEHWKASVDNLINDLCPFST
ncbi:hypothetical protein H4R33_006897, partial [Dimargaris cristalligena]